jgi:hypothetical protein
MNSLYLSKMTGIALNQVVFWVVCFLRMAKAEYVFAKKKTSTTRQRVKVEAISHRGIMRASSQDFFTSSRIIQ